MNTQFFNKAAFLITKNDGFDHKNRPLTIDNAVLASKLVFSMLISAFAIAAYMV